ncbi:MAG: ABC transporter [Gammaproteobacteria bacterium 39-13]|nr:ABC transporter ATP-binding protein [Gammaproteobacteria bacterium]OJV87901.1 MAG: ABC transporter [Gammaproteobacteria bacterium 39-13]
MKALVLNKLQKQYPNGIKAVKGISLEVEQGNFFGLLGPNGAGKSTTIGIISSLVNKTSGVVSIFGYDLDKQPEKAKAQIGLVPQEFNFNVFERVIDILTNQAGYYGIPYRVATERAAFYLKKLGLWDKAKEPARNLSGGLKRRLMIARGLIHDPRLLILDEPTAGVDIELRRATWSFLQEINAQGTTIILTTHYLEEAESLCRRVAIINHGEIIEDMGVKQLLSKLDKETLVLDLATPVKTLPHIEGFELLQKDDLTLEVSFHRQTSLNTLFEAFSQLGLQVVSLRNKTNRLEELFLDLVQTKGNNAT